MLLAYFLLLLSKLGRGLGDEALRVSLLNWQDGGGKPTTRMPRPQRARRHVAVVDASTDIIVVVTKLIIVIITIDISHH